ncbi:MAG: hypothetical protein MN733_16425 [Nitrososphaera sp.]|nr:hypothetical protein [Nitrososphaera sp.]
MFELDFSDVKPSVISWIVVGLMAISFIAVAKYAIATIDNPVTRFFRPVVAAV